jgi:arylsulfatase A
VVSRRQWLAGLAGTLGPRPGAAQQNRPPNIILILTDDQGWWDIGANGNPHVKTPNIDRLAKEGVRFTHFYCSPVCTPTRAAILTGRHYQRTGAIDTYRGRDTLDLSEVTLGQALRDNGYRTACVGKWHLGRYMRYHPNHRGFDEYFGFWQYGFMNIYDDSPELWDNKKPVAVEGYITDVLTTRAVHFIKSAKERPFFLYLTYNAPHSPYLVPDKYIDPYLKAGLPLREARIYGMLTSIDENVGRVVASVDAAGLADNTVVIYMSDNGGVSNFHKCGLRGNKGSCFEGGTRVPFIARWPRRFPAGAVVEAPAQHIDLYPTLCELTGTSLPGGPARDGTSIVPLLSAGGGESPHKYIYSQWNRLKPVLETVPGNEELRASWSIRDRDGMKLHSSGHLFDLRVDPGEQTNVAPKQPEKANELRREFERWFADVTSRNYSRVPIEIGRADENPVEIDVTWGDPSGKVRPQYRNYNRDTIENWVDMNDTVQWKVDVVAPGEYELILVYGCEPGQGGSRARFQIGEASIEYTFTDTPGRMVFARRAAGRLRLARGSATLVVKPTHIAGKELAAIHKIWLRRI